MKKYKCFFLNVKGHRFLFDFFFISRNYFKMQKFIKYIFKKPSFLLTSNPNLYIKFSMYLQFLLQCSGILSELG